MLITIFLLTFVVIKRGEPMDFILSQIQIHVAQAANCMEVPGLISSMKNVTQGFKLHARILLIIN